MNELNSIYTKSFFGGCLTSLTTKRDAYVTSSTGHILVGKSAVNFGTALAALPLALLILIEGIVRIAISCITFALTKCTPKAQSFHDTYFAGSLSLTGSLLAKSMRVFIKAWNCSSPITPKAADPINRGAKPTASGLPEIHSFPSLLKMCVGHESINPDELITLFETYPQNLYALRIAIYDTPKLFDLQEAIGKRCFVLDILEIYKNMTDLKKDLNLESPPLSREAALTLFANAFYYATRQPKEWVNGVQRRPHVKDRKQAQELMKTGCLKEGLKIFLRLFSSSSTTTQKTSLSSIQKQANQMAYFAMQASNNRICSDSYIDFLVNYLQKNLQEFKAPQEELLL